MARVLGELESGGRTLGTLPSPLPTQPVKSKSLGEHVLDALSGAGDFVINHNLPGS